METRKLDRRQQKTRTAIFEALARLLKKKKFEEITVQEIIDEANVGRTTFYAHFETKDYLLKEMCSSIFDHVLDTHQHKETSHDFTLKNRTLTELLTHVLYHLQDEKEEMLDILLTDSADLFLGYFSENIQILLMQNPDLLPELPLNTPKDYQVQMIADGIVQTVRWWAGKRMEYSPEQVAEYFESVFL